MNCETLRDRLAENPTAGNAAFDEHAERCAPCRAYRRRLLRAEALIAAALQIDIGSSPRVPHAGPAMPLSRWTSVAAGLAAAVIAALTFWSFAGGSLRVAPTELAAAVLAHWEHEPDSLRASAAQVSLDDLADVLMGTAEMDQTALGRVSYARLCRVGGRFLPHLVVQGDTGPYMVLLLPGEAFESAISLSSSDQGLAGTIFPSGNGSIAVLGSDTGNLDDMETLVASAVNWTAAP